MTTPWTQGQRLSADAFNSAIPGQWVILSPLGGTSNIGSSQPTFKARLVYPDTLQFMGALNVPAGIANGTAIGAVAYNTDPPWPSLTPLTSASLTVSGEAVSSAENHPALVGSPASDYGEMCIVQVAQYNAPGLVGGTVTDGAGNLMMITWSVYGVPSTATVVEFSGYTNLVRAAS